MDTFQIRRGEALPLTVQLSDDQGNPITTYTGSESLACVVWPGGDQAVTLTPAVAWISGPAGTISLLISPSQTTTTAEGRYWGKVTLQDESAGWLEAYGFALDVLLAPGTAVAPPSYCSFPDLLKYGKVWLRTLQTEDDDAGFSQQCGRARSWLDDLIIAGWQVSYPIGVGDPGYGAVLVGQNPGQLPSIWLRQQLDAGGLVMRDLVVEITAKKALSYICEGQIGSGNTAFDFAKLARYFHGEANELAKTLRAEINPDSNGYPQFAVNLGQKSMRR